MKDAWEQLRWVLVTLVVAAALTVIAVVIARSVLRNAELQRDTARVCIETHGSWVDNKCVRGTS